MRTELFTQYIENNGGADVALPSLFDKIPSITINDETTTFKDAFVLNFSDREIGFETEALFALKLEGRAKLVIPRYVHKLEELAQLDYIGAQRTETETRKVTTKITDGGTDTVTRTTSGTSTDSGADTITHETSVTSTDSGADTITHETSVTSSDSGMDANTRFKGENPLIDTSLNFNAKAVSEQEQNAINYGKTNTTYESGKNATKYGKTNTKYESGTNATKYGKTNTTSGGGTDSTNYGKTTDNTSTDTVTREYTNDNIEVYELYNRVLDNSVNIWKEIFNEFDSLFLQIW